MRIICRLEAVFEETKMKKQTAKIFFKILSYNNI